MVRFQVLITAILFTVFWDGGPCSLIGTEVITACIIALVIKAISTMKHRSVVTRLHGPASQQAFIC
jgi:hypothetical protein